MHQTLALQISVHRFERVVLRNVPEMPPLLPRLLPSFEIVLTRINTDKDEVERQERNRKSENLKADLSVVDLMRGFKGALHNHNYIRLENNNRSLILLSFF